MDCEVWGEAEKPQEGTAPVTETNEKPSVESLTCLTSSVLSPRKPDSVMPTNVAPSSRDTNVHSTVLSPLYPGHSMTMRLFGSIAFALTGRAKLYISQAHCTNLPASSLPLLLVNQNFVVMSGLMKASKTSATGLRMSIPVLDTSALGRPFSRQPFFLRLFSSVSSRPCWL